MNLWSASDLLVPNKLYPDVCVSFESFIIWSGVRADSWPSVQVPCILSQSGQSAANTHRSCADTSNYLPYPSACVGIITVALQVELLAFANIVACLFMAGIFLSSS